MVLNLNTAEGRDPLALKLPNESFVISQTKQKRVHIINRIRTLTF